MKIYKKCPCCGKTIFLMLGSDFGNDNIPHSDISHEQDWDYLAKFLTCLKTSHGEVFISLKSKERDKLPKEILKWTENYKEEPKEPEEKEKDKDWTKWKNIDLNLTDELINQWGNKGFDYEKTENWIKAGLKVNDANYAYWLENVAKIDYWKYLNDINQEENQELRKQFKEHLTI